MKAGIAYLLMLAVFASIGLITCSKLSLNQSAPDVPSAPSPANGDALDSVTIELSWSCSDPDGDPISYDIYLDTSATPAVLIATVDTTSYTPMGLHYNSTYYWQIVATDTTGLISEGPVWSFSFGSDMIDPTCSLTSPNGGELWYIGSDQTITWDAEDDDGIEFFLLEYSIDQSNNWVMIGDTISGGVRDTSWVIPSTPTVIARVRIICQDTGGNLVADTSDEIFTIWPQGGMITFGSDRDGDIDVYTIYPDGTNPRNLTETLGVDTYPVWSPDCSKICFHSNRDGNYEIYTMNFDGTDQLNISNNQADDAYPDWSLSGDKIVFSSRRRNVSYYDIWTMDSDGTNLIPVTNNNFHEYGADLSPSGEYIAYHNNQDGGDWEIFVIDSEGLTTPVRLTNNGVYDAYPQWSPDGQMIVFCSNRDGNYEIYTMNANGSNPRRITNHAADDNHPSWSPDGSRIVFQSTRTGDWEIWSIDPDNLSDLQNISNNLGTDADPSWSPIH